MKLLFNSQYYTTHSQNKKCSSIMAHNILQSLEQFHVDAPRISFYINASEYLFHTTADFHKYIITFAKQHNHQQEKLIYWCTQIPLATIYTEKHTQLIIEAASKHLLDNGRQRVTFDEHTGHMHITKPFRIDIEDHKGHFDTEQYLSLHVTVCPSKEKVQWIKHEHNTQPMNATNTMDHIGTVGVVCALAIAYFVVQ